MKKIIVILLLAFLISCSSSVIFQSFDQAVYPPTQKVDIYTTEKPERDYTEIGRIVVKEGISGSQDMMTVAMKKAGEIGADGLILLSEDKDTGYVVTGNMILPGSFEKLIFVAIKYKEN